LLPTLAGHRGRHLGQSNTISEKIINIYKLNYYKLRRGEARLVLIEETAAKMGKLNVD
jgi:hypothetical protein